MTPAAPPEVVHAYRHLLRAGLRAVQFSKPARFAVRDQLRAGFRETPAARSARAALAQPPSSLSSSPASLPQLPLFDAAAVQRTVEFLEAAAAERGLEHRILRNLLRVAWARRRAAERSNTWALVLRERGARRQKQPDRIVETAYDHYERTIAMLNQTMGLCLR